MNTRPKIVVVGSSNTDLVVRSSRAPLPGETIIGESFATVAGGKGANQAVAAARLGADVTFIARVGDDAFGQSALDGFASEGIDTSRIIRDSSAPTGVALINVVSATGQNSIVIVSGANGNLSLTDVAARADAIRAADILLCQLETPIETVAAALSIARSAGVTTILNPAPAMSLSDEVLANVDILTPNETEATAIAGDISLNPMDAAKALRERGIATVIVTLGADGAYIASAPFEGTVAGRAVESVVDTTAAGDCFTAALAVALAEHRELRDAVSFAHVAAGISVGRAGAQPSLPTRAEVDVVLSVVR